MSRTVYMDGGHNKKKMTKRKLKTKIKVKVNVKSKRKAKTGSKAKAKTGAKMKAKAKAKAKTGAKTRAKTRARARARAKTGAKTKTRARATRARARAKARPRAKTGVTRKRYVDATIPFACRKLVDCMMFLQEYEQILSFFNFFIDFQYFVKSSGMKKNNLQVNNNGDIDILTYRRQNISVQTLLKSSQLQTSDNLYYEYCAGMYINTLLKTFPCFVHTYGVYFAPRANDKRIVNMTRMKNDNDGLKLACLGPLNLRLMVQYIENITLRTYMEREKTSKHFMSNMVQILFQVYGPLAAIGNSFTHYDLHDMNVLLYILPNNQYIDMEYRYGKHIVAFKTNIVAKIIDYGRCYFPDSLRMSQEVCDTSECTDEQTCGKDFGFAVLGKKVENLYWIDSYKKNRSHDLRLTQFVKDHLSPLHEPLKSLIDNVVYVDFYGTPENLTQDPIKSYCIGGFLRHLTNIVSSPNFAASNDTAYRSMTKKGSMVTSMTGSNKILFVPN